MITATTEAIEAMRAFMEKNELHRPVRIELQSTGCCDASLGLLLDSVRDGDIKEEIQGIVFVASPELINLTGDISVTCNAGTDGMDFVVTSEKPISEWSGFGSCKLRVK